MNSEEYLNFLHKKQENLQFDALVQQDNAHIHEAKKLWITLLKTAAKSWIGPH